MKNPNAFPGTHEYYDNHSIKQLSRFDGMTLRDYFAAKALFVCPHNYHEIEKNVKHAYMVADAMLKERNG